MTMAGRASAAEDAPNDEQLFHRMERVRQSILLAVAPVLEKQCAAENEQFMRCKAHDIDPAVCLKEGRVVTNCAAKVYDL